jgi:hypothetical protein
VSRFKFRSWHGVIQVWFSKKLPEGVLVFMSGGASGFKPVGFGFFEFSLSAIALWKFCLKG